MQQEQKELLQALYREYQGLLRLAALKYGAPESEIDDIIQDTFYALINKYENDFPEWNELQQKAMLMRILLNRCADYFRKVKRLKEISMDSGDSEIEFEILQSQVRRDFCDDLIEKENYREIQEMIKSMSPVLREVALLHMVEGRPVDEVCEHLKISNSACRMRISRIRKYMREQLKDMDQFS